MRLLRFAVLALALPAIAAAAAPRPREAGPAGPTRLGAWGFEAGPGGWRLSPEQRVVADPAQAHSGRGAVVGAVAGRGHGLTLTRTLKLRRDRLYRLTIWAKASNGSRLTVWRRTAGVRHVVTTWTSVPQGWKRHQIVFTVEQDGPTTLGLVAPSSHSASPGRMWIDDVSLFEQRPIPVTALSGDAGFDDGPALAPAPGGAFAAWSSFREGHDTLRAARLRAAGGTARTEAAWEVIGGPGAAILDPALAADGEGGAWLFWSQELEGDWEVRAVHLGPKGPGPVATLAPHPGADLRPAGAVVGGRLVLAWVSARGGERAIWTAEVTLGEGAVPEAGPPARLSAPGVETYAPTVAGTPGGPVWVAWQAWRDASTDLWARRRAGDGWAPAVRLTRAPAVDREPVLAAGGGEVWIAWERATYQAFRIGETRRRRVQVARLTPDGRLEQPRGLGRTGLALAAEAPGLAVGPGGAVWIAARVPRGPHAGWDVQLWRWDGAFHGPWHLSKDKGMSRTPGLVLLPTGALAAWQSDDLSDWFASVEASRAGHSRIVAAVLPAANARARRRRFEAVPVRVPHPPAAEAKALGMGHRGWTVPLHGRKVALLFGDLHEHSDISRCHRTIDDTQAFTWQMMRNLARYDFGALTDHGYNLNAYLWNLSAKRVRAFTGEGFLALLGQEWTSTFETPAPGHPYGYYGHRNLVYSDPYVDRWYDATDGMTPAEVWADLRSRHVDFVHVPHQLADRGNVPVDWSFVDDAAQPVAEIHQIRGSYECEHCPRRAKNTTPAGWFLQDAWARGVVIGVVAAPEHQGGAGLAAVYVEDRSREGILEGLRARRTYGTTGAKILLDVRVGPHFMGEVGPPSDGTPVPIHVRVLGTAPLRSVEVLRNNEVLVARRRLGTAEVNLHFMDASPPAGAAWYYVRVTQTDGQMAWSSPVWLGRPALRPAPPVRPTPPIRPARPGTRPE